MCEGRFARRAGRTKRTRWNSCGSGERFNVPSSLPRWYGLRHDDPANGSAGVDPVSVEA